VNVLFALRAPCVVCGHQLHGVCAANVRVNVRSVRTVGTYLHAVNPSCPECGDTGTSLGDRWAWHLTPADALRVSFARGKLGRRRKVTT